MTLPVSARRNDYNGTSTLHVYAYGFKIFDDDDLLVTVLNTSGVETTLTKTTDYSVSSVGAASGGNITLVDASQAWLTSGELTTGYKLTILGNRGFLQDTSIRNQGEFYPNVIEDEWDKQVILLQQLKEKINRCVTFVPTSTASGLTIPAPEASSVPMMNSGATAFEWITRASLVGETGATGATGATGSVGQTGTRGSLWTTGSGAPSASVNAGDLYLDTATGDVWQYS